MKKVKVCHCCGQIMMIYRRTIRLNMLCCLRKLFFAYKYEAVKAHALEPDGVLSADFEKLRYWGLIESVEGNLWKITAKGIAFILGRTSIPKYIWLYNQQAQPMPDGEQNPEIFCWDIAPEKISKEIVLRDARSYPVEDEKQMNFFEKERI